MPHRAAEAEPWQAVQLREHAQLVLSARVVQPVRFGEAGKCLDLLSCRQPRGPFISARQAGWDCQQACSDAGRQMLVNRCPANAHLGEKSKVCTMSTAGR